jgi:predicted DNA-binding WGR domain protein
LGGPNGNLEFVFVTYSARGSHQGGPMHTYNKHIALASKDEKVLESLMKFLQKHITKGKVRRTIKRGGGKKRTIHRRNANSAYFEFRSGSSRKFWRIVKNGSKITTHYGKLGTLGQMTTKDYGSKVDQTFDSLLKSKKKKGYMEKTDYGDSNPKPPTKVEREYMKTCNKAENSKVLNPNMISYDCEGMMDQGEAELKWMTGWHKDALKNKDYDWSKYEEHSKSKRKKKKTLKGAGRKLKKIKKRSHKMNQSSNSVRGKNKALEKLWTDMSNMKKYVFIMKDGSYQIKSVEPSYKGQRGSRFMEKYCLPMIEKANNDDSVKMILSAGNSYDGYEQLYDDVGNSSVDQVLKDYKKYWKYQIDDKLYTC